MLEINDTVCGELFRNRTFPTLGFWAVIIIIQENTEWRNSWNGFNLLLFVKKNKNNIHIGLHMKMKYVCVNFSFTNSTVNAFIYKHMFSELSQNENFLINVFIYIYILSSVTLHLNP